MPFVNVPSEPAPVFDRDNAIFTAKVPAMGYAVYYYTQAVNFNRPRTSDAYKAKPSDPLTLENAHLAVKFAQNGNIQSIVDKRNGKELLSGETQAVVIDETEHDTWSHNKNYFDKEIGRFAVTSIEKIESNEIREIIKVTAEYGDSTLAQYYTLSAEEDMVRVRVKLNWNMMV